MVQTDFSEEDARRLIIKTIKLIKLFNPSQIIFKCIDSLHKIPEKEEEWIQYIRRYQPWILLFIIKLSFLHGNHLKHYAVSLNDKYFHAILQSLKNVENCIRMPNDYDNPFLFLRAMAFQQFWLQELPNMSRFTRQSYLFRELAKTPLFESTFKEITNSEFQPFIELSFGLYTKFITEPQYNYLHQTWFDTIEGQYKNREISYFFGTLSKTKDYLIPILKDHKEQYKSISYQIMERTPLRYFPLLQYGNRHYCYYRNVLFHSLHHYIYDLLKGRLGGNFVIPFSKIFEEYIRIDLDAANQVFLREDELAQAMSSGSKVVDFLVLSENDNILIDAKAVEMNYLGRVSHLSDVIKDKTKSSVLKGIEQGIGTVNELKKTREICGHILGSGQYYLIIVTYKDLFLGNGKDYYLSSAKAQIDELYERYGGRDVLPVENMYFISIDDFDLIMSAIINNNVSFSDIIRAAIVNDSRPETKCLVFRQHVNNREYKIQLLSHIESHGNEIVSNMMEKLDSNSAA